MTVHYPNFSRPALLRRKVQLSAEKSEKPGFGTNTALTCGCIATGKPLAIEILSAEVSSTIPALRSNWLMERNIWRRPVVQKCKSCVVSRYSVAWVWGGEGGD